MAELLGFARTPPAVRTSLLAAAEATVVAAIALNPRATNDTSRDTVRVATDQARAHSRDAVAATASATGWGLDRSDTLGMAVALRGIADRIDEVAIGLVRVDRFHGPDPWTDLLGIVRDLTRAVFAAVRTLDGPADERDAHLAAIDQLRREGRTALRDARRSMLAADQEPITALAAHDLLIRIEHAITGCLAAESALRTTLLKHR
jgi:hypothetical protein